MKEPKYNIQYTKYFILFLFLLAFLERTLFDLGPNYELITATMILSSYFLGTKYTFWPTFFVVALSDRLIGNSNIFLFTWSGFLIPALVLPKLIKNLKFKISNSKRKFFWFLGAGISSNLFFYIFTNLGVWLLDSWGMYTKDLPGLIHCYINALPFLKNQLTSSIIFIPLGHIILRTSFVLFKKTIKFTNSQNKYAKEF